MRKWVVLRLCAPAIASLAAVCLSVDRAQAQGCQGPECICVDGARGPQGPPGPSDPAVEQMVREIKGHICGTRQPGEMQASFCDPLTVFVTADSWLRSGGPESNIDGADEFCNQSAEAAGLAGTYVAWLSKSDVDAVDRITEAAYARVDGMPVAASKADLTDGTIANPISVSESGAALTGEVWTGTLSPGTAARDTCHGWRDATGSFDGRVGNSTSSGPEWTSFSTRTCETDLRVYCFQR